MSSMNKLKTSAVILAGGLGSRMHSDKTKQFIEINGKTILERTVLAFNSSALTDEIILVVRADEESLVSDMISNLSLNKPIKTVVGGACRPESARNGFLAMDPSFDLVAIHDAARCLITPDMIDKVIAKAHTVRAATAACTVFDTVKTVDSEGKVTSTIPRERVYRAQTPQVFAKEIYKRALDASDAFDAITDDNMMVEKIGVDIYAVDLGQENIKITTTSDLTLAESILKKRGEHAVNGLRIGHGYDVHRLSDDRKLIIGGVEIPYDKGLLGHSDADVLLHAIMDALLGAAALGDIGRHFPDTSDEYKGISSMHLLSRVADLIAKNGFYVVNVDATLIMQRPKVAPYVPKMISNIAFALGIDESCVNVKATTEERLGFTGREEGASAHSVVLIAKK